MEEREGVNMQRGKKINEKEEKKEEEQEEE